MDDLEPFLEEIHVSFLNNFTQASLRPFLLLEGGGAARK